MAIDWSDTSRQDLFDTTVDSLAQFGEYELNAIIAEANDRLGDIRDPGSYARKHTEAG